LCELNHDKCYRNSALEGPDGVDNLS